jgi:hypothetical protein
VVCIEGTPDWVEKDTQNSCQKLLDCRRMAIPKEAFADSFQKLYERCQPCVVKDGDYFEGQ